MRNCEVGHRWHAAQQPARGITSGQAQLTWSVHPEPPSRSCRGSQVVRNTSAPCRSPNTAQHAVPSYQKGKQATVCSLGVVSNRSSAFLLHSKLETYGAQVPSFCRHRLDAGVAFVISVAGKSRNQVTAVFVMYLDRWTLAGL